MSINNILMSAAGNKNAPFVACSMQYSPYGCIYPFLNEYGARSVPSALPSSVGNDLAFSPDGKFLVFSTSRNINTPYQTVSIYPVSDNGVGSLFASIETSTSSYAYGVCFSPNCKYIAVSDQSTAIHVYNWSSSGLGTEITGGSFAAGSIMKLKFSPNNDYIAYASGSTPYVNMIPFSASGFGTKIANPASITSATSFDVSFSPDGNYVAFVHISSPYLSIYPFNGSFGTRIVPTATEGLPSSSGNGVAFSPDGNYIAVAHDNLPCLAIYPWNNGTLGTKIVPTATEGLIETGYGYAYSVALSQDGAYIAVGHDTTPYITIYPWNNGTLGTKITAPTTTPGSKVTGVAFRPLYNNY